MLACDVELLERVQHAHVREIGPRQRQDQVVVHHLLLILGGLRNELVHAHVVQEGLVEIVEHQGKTRSTGLPQHPEHKANHIPEEDALSYLSQDHYQVFTQVLASAFEDVQYILIFLAKRAHISEGAVSTFKSLSCPLFLGHFFQGLLHEFQLLGDLDAEQIIKSLEAADADALLEDVDCLEGEDFFLLFQAVKAIGSEKESTPVGVRQLDELVQQFPEKGVAVFILAFRQGNALIIVELLIPHVFG